METPARQREQFPLRVRTVLITGVSRREGIGYATACRLAAFGASIFCHHFSPHDRQQPWGADDLTAVLVGIRSHLIDGAQLADAQADLTEPGAPENLAASAFREFGRVDAVICNHALSGSDGGLGDLNAAMLDRHWAVNTRASILLAQAFVQKHSEGDPASIVFLTSGQERGPMPGEVAYAAAKAALAGVTLTLADKLAPCGIRVNAVNPGPVNTGCMSAEDAAALAPRFPFGTQPRPQDPARLIAWLVTDEAAWITGQVLNTEGGFRCWG